MKGFEQYNRRSRLQIFQSMFLRKKVKWHSWRLPAGDLHKLGIYIGDTWICPPPPLAWFIHSCVSFFSLRKKHTTGQKGSHQLNGSLFLHKMKVSCMNINLSSKTLTFNSEQFILLPLPWSLTNPRWEGGSTTSRALLCELNCQFIQRGI